MTIKELEERTGMARANIRFYEGEGLLSPRRLDNGYRDYSEEDARTLEKIKLLRQLQLDIGTIRRVQGGALTLEQALFSQLTRLEGDRAVIERAAAVCRELEQSGVEYAALDPRPWLRQMEEPQRPALPEPPPAREERDDAPRACYCPWQRLFARSLDMALYGTILNMVWLIAFRDQSLVRLQTVPIASFLCGVGLLALTLALEPLWLHCWGWTPGKWVFGLKLRDGDGTRLSLAQGWERGWRVAWEGYGWNIPIWNLWRMWKGRTAGLEGRDCPWDCEEGYRYTKEERPYSGWIFVAARVLLTAALVVTLLWSALPPCRGELTVEEFARNYNHFRSQIMWGDGLPRMEADGRWAERADGYGQDGTVQTKVHGVWIELDAPIWEEPEFTVEDGCVKAVTLRVTGGCLGGVPSVQREMLAVLALSGATEHWSLLNPDVDGWLEAAVKALSRPGGGEVQERGLRVTQREEISGYQETGTEIYWSLTPIVGEKQHYERVVTISLE